ncbi:MAG TPA: hypothetical protein EYG92_05830 [Lutibacter sp.]|nr:hypothetical protein [Lutibacter sp.]
MPVTYSYSNQGDNLDYQIPFKFNRLSLHPKYKWIQAHIGDVNMTFSPYTLSAHQFTGGGLELSPKGGFKIATMYGQLIKATEDDEDPRTIPAFKRMGYGSKISYTGKKYSVGVIGFYAKDEINSITAVPDEKGVVPKENLVLSLEAGYKFTKNLEIKAEYASTAITQDLRAEDQDLSSGLAGGFFNNKASTEFYSAIKTAIDYKIKKSSIGLAYERIEPGYETLGAYYFNNDFENITVNTTTMLFKDKLNLAFNIGYQRDDLKQQKEAATSRTVGSLNATFNASKKLNITGSYSNFSTFTNLKSNQFDVINDDDLLDDERDALDYRQLSQNANLNLNFIISNDKERKQNINFNYALADVSNEQGGVVRIGDASTFHNISTSYSLGFPNSDLTITPVINATYNTIGRENATTWGSTLVINKKFYDKTLSTTFASSYSNSTNKDSKNNVFNLRANATYSYKKKHNFNLNAIQLFKNYNDVSAQNITITFGYNYSFDINKPKFPTRNKREKIKEPKIEKEQKKKVKKLKPKKEKKEKVKVFGFSYREHKFEGIPKTILPEILEISKQDKFKSTLEIKHVRDKLQELEKKMTNAQSSKKDFKKAAITYLKHLYHNKDLKYVYDNLVFKSLKKLYTEAERMSFAIRKSYIEIQGKVNTAKENGNVDNIDIVNLQKKTDQLNAHFKMMDNLNQITFEDVQQDRGLLKVFKNQNLNKVFELLESDTKEIEIKKYLESNLIKLYHKDALKSTSK